MKWMRERDLLIAQTLAFVQSVGGKLPESARPPETAEAATTPSVEPAIETPVAVDAGSPPVDMIAAPIEIAPQETAAQPADEAPVLPPPVQWPVPAAFAEAPVQAEPAPPIVTQAEPQPDFRMRIDLREDFQSEIRARVASFRAHQERFTREREAYCSTTMAKVHASIRDVGLPTRE